MKRPKSLIRKEQLWRKRKYAKMIMKTQRQKNSEIYHKHETKGRIRVHMAQKTMTCRQADTLLYYLTKASCVTKAKVYDRTGDAVIFILETEKKSLPYLKSLTAKIQRYPQRFWKIPEEN